MPPFALGKLYGRESETKTLQEAYRRVCDDQQQELLLISGTAGTGKTALALHLNSADCFVQGKFEENAVQSPYEVFVHALTEYVDKMVDSKNLETLQLRIARECGTDACLLLDLVPALDSLLKCAPTTKRVHLYGTEAMNRLRHVFCAFIHALTTVTPLVIFLDDLQWADTASMELVRSLMQYDNMALLLLGTHRCGNLAQQTSPQDYYSCVACNQLMPFRATLKDLEREKPDARITLIGLQDLSLSSVRDLLQDVIGRSKASHEPLAQVVMAQTHGNIFHVLQFLRLLIDQGFMRQDDNEYWIWDNETIRQQIGSEETILELVGQNMAQLSRIAQEALKVASCLGDDLDDSALDLVLQTSTGKYLEEAAERGLLTFYPHKGGYRFAHDWIRQAAYSLIPVDEREEFHLNMGRRLWKGSTPAALNKNITLIVSILNKGTKLMKEQRERYKVAELNLKAAEAAISVSSYPDASKFIRKGISMLGNNRWNDYYTLTISLYSTGGEVEVINGHFERVRSYIGEVVNNGLSLDDKLRAYASLLRAMALQDDLDEAVSTGVGVLKQLGEPIPTNPTKFSLAKELLKVKMSLRGRSNADILKMPLMVDPRKIACIEFLNLIFMASYRLRSPYAPLAAFRSVTLSLKYGLHKYTASGFSVYGMLLCALGSDMEGGYRFGQLAITLAQNMQSRDVLNARDVLPMVHLLNGMGILHWVKPMKEQCLDELLFAGKMGMETGQVEVAMMARNLRASYSLFTGRNIQATKEDVLESLRMARFHRMQSIECLCMILLQLLHCLQGRANNASFLTGQAIDFEESLKEAKQANNKFRVANLYAFAVFLAYLFGDYARASELAEKNAQILENAPSSTYFGPHVEFMHAMTELALESSKRKYVNHAKEVLKSLTKWAKHSPHTYLVKQKLLEAELSVVKNRKHVAVNYALYDQAIQEALRHGYVCDVALGYERSAVYRAASGDRQGAAQYWDKAIVAYEEWGATAKVAALRKALKKE